MVAPIDAKVEFEVEGEKITLRLNFRSLALAKQQGVNILGGDLDPLDLAVAVKAMAVQDHPEMTDDEALAVIMRGGESAVKALADLFDQFAGKGGSGGNGRAS